MLPCEICCYTFSQFLSCSEEQRLKGYETAAFLKSPTCFIPWHVDTIGLYQLDVHFDLSLVAQRCQSGSGLPPSIVLPIQVHAASQIPVVYHGRFTLFHCCQASPREYCVVERLCTAHSSNISLFWHRLARGPSRIPPRFSPIHSLSLILPSLQISHISNHSDFPLSPACSLVPTQPPAEKDHPLSRVLHKLTPSSPAGFQHCDIAPASVAFQAARKVGRQSLLRPLDRSPSRCRFVSVSCSCPKQAFVLLADLEAYHA